MDACPRPPIEYPCRVPLKVIGKFRLLQSEQVAEVILEHLGPQPEADQAPSAKLKGTYISYTYWVTLPDEHAERPLREAIMALPGYVMQL